MNKYLEKVAKLLSEENKQVGKTFAAQTVASAPAHIVGGIVGGKLLGNKLEKPGIKILGSINNKLNTLGKPGRWLASHVKGGPGIGLALGAGLGTAVAGGVADLATLKASLHGKVKENE